MNSGRRPTISSSSQQFGHPLLAALACFYPRDRLGMDHHRFANQIEERHAGVERGEGVLKDHLHTSGGAVDRAESETA